MADEKKEGPKYPHGCWLYKGEESQLFHGDAEIAKAKKAGWKDEPTAPKKDE